MFRLLAPFVIALTLFAAERPVPPPGVAVPEADQQELRQELKALGESVAELKKKFGPKSNLVADVAIFHEAVRYALDFNEFLKPEEIARGKRMLSLGRERAAALLQGQPLWTKQTGLVVRGYFSKIDDSVQPYGLVIPESWSPSLPAKMRLDTWFHGRSETLTELNFLHDRITNAGQFTPRDTIVLHLYGRYCNANKFAGEVDLFEALDAVKKEYKIDSDRISVRGFSMGGAAVWHLAAHHAGLWAAAAPGAGFSETAEFLNVFEKEKVHPAWWEQKLWRMYDATVYSLNFFNLPLVAYSGEIDRQIQAARVMEREMAKEGMTLRHIIGPNTPHRYHPDAKVAIDAEMDAIVERGRDPYPRRVRFVTYTLRYDRMKWIQVDSLEHHWEEGRIDAQVVSDNKVTVKASGITGFTLDFGPGGCPLDSTAKVTVIINGKAITVDPPQSDRSWKASFDLIESAWEPRASNQTFAIAKRHGLQGPIDDAFMDRFIIVKPTGTALNAGTGEWVNAEMNRAIREWRRQFRGEAIVKNDTEVTEQDAQSANLVLWGDPSSNKVIALIAGRLPMLWNAKQVLVGDRSFPGGTHVPVMIYPNPVNPKRYVVLNSGFTFREYDYLNNARQVSKLPDWAVVDITTAPDSRWPGKIADAGFFGERWEVLEGPEKAAPKPTKKPTAPAKKTE